MHSCFNSTICCREATMKFLTSCILAILALAAVAAGSVKAADYPERNITVIVPFPPGGASDMTARLITAKLSERVRQAVSTDNPARAHRSHFATALQQAPAERY